MTISAAIIEFAERKGLTMADLRELASLIEESADHNGVTSRVTSRVTEDVTPALRSPAAVRQHRYRENRRERGRNDDHNGVTSRGDQVEKTEAYVESNNLDSKNQKSPLKGAKKGSAKSPRSILEEVLPAQTASEVIAHRKALKSPLTAGAARGLAKAFVAFGDAPVAAQAMMTNGWRGFKPEWMVDARGARAGPPVRRNPHLEAYENDQRRRHHERNHDDATGHQRPPSGDHFRSAEKYLVDHEDASREAERRAALARDRDADRRAALEDDRASDDLEGLFAAGGR